MRARPIIAQFPGNKTEARYAQHLEIQKKAGEILDWRFEAVKLRLADKTFYTPDFLVIKPEHICLVEVKGFMREDAAVKLKVAAHQYPWVEFVLVRYSKGKWEHKSL